MNIRALISDVVYWFSAILRFSILLRILLSWLPMRTPDLLYQITEPILAPIRQMIRNSPLGGTMLDFSAVLALILIQIITNAILSVI